MRASVLPLDPQGVGLAEGDVAPEDVFNPILYKAMSNKGMSQLEARINAITANGSGLDVNGDTAAVEVDTFTSATDEFPIYYGLLSNTREWRHANPQAGLEMKGLKPLVYEMVYNVGDMTDSVYDASNPASFEYPTDAGSSLSYGLQKIVGKAKSMPFLNCTSFSSDGTSGTAAQSGFDNTNRIGNAEQDVPYINVVCGCIIVPPSRLHELFFRMVCEWTLEFSTIRPIGDITDWTGLSRIGSTTHYQNYSYEATKEAITGSSDSLLDCSACMVSSNAEIKKVM